MKKVEKSLRSVHLTIFLLKQPIPNALTPEARQRENDARFRAFLALFDTLIGLLEDCIHLDPTMEFGSGHARYPWDSLPNNPSPRELAVAIFDTSTIAIWMFGELDLKELPRALPLLDRVKTEATRILGRDDATVMWVMVELAEIYMNQRNWDGADSETMAVAEIMKSRGDLDLNNHHWKCLVRLINSQEVQDWELAEELLTKALPLVQESLGPEHPDTVGMKVALGRTYWFRGKLVEAESFLLSAVEAAEWEPDVLDNADVLETMNTLAWLHIQQANWEEAENFIFQMIEKAQFERGVMSDWWVCRGESMMGELHLRRARWRDAEEIFSHGLIACSWRCWQAASSFEPELNWHEVWNELRVIHTQGLAKAYFSQGRAQEAQNLLRSASLLEITWSRTAAWVATFRNIGLLCLEYKDWPQAEVVIVALVETLNTWSSRGPDHAYTLEWMEKLSFVYVQRNRWEEAAGALEDLVARLETLRGFKDDDTARNVDCLQFVYRKLGRWSDNQQLGFKILQAKGM